MSDIFWKSLLDKTYTGGKLVRLKIGGGEELTAE